MSPSGQKLANAFRVADGSTQSIHRFLRARPAVRATLVAALTASGISVAVIPVRDSVGTANVGLALGIVVALVGARAGLRAGLATAFLASALFALLHSVPHGLPRVEEEQDLLTAVLLLLAGLLGGWFHGRAARRDARLREMGLELQRLHHVAEAAAGSGTAEDVIAIIAEAVRAELGLSDCYWETGPGVGRWRELHHNGLIDGLSASSEASARGQALTDGVAIDFGDKGRLVLLGRDGMPPSPRQLKVAVVLADFGIALLRLDD